MSPVTRASDTIRAGAFFFRGNVWGLATIIWAPVVVVAIIMIAAAVTGEVGALLATISGALP